MELNTVTEIEHNLLEAQKSVAAGMTRIFDLVADLAEAGAHEDYPSASAWLSWHLGLADSTTRLWVRIARALRQFPVLRAAYSSGEISIDQLRLVLRVAKVDNQVQLLKLARIAGDAAGLRKEINAMEQRAIEEPTEDSDHRPYLYTGWRNDQLYLKGAIPAADGVLVEQALHRLGAKAPLDEQTGLFRNPEVRAAEALVQMASQSMAADGDHDRATIVVHMSASDLVNEQGPSWEAATRIFTAEELRRMTCDARFQPAMHDADGTTVGVGRTTRKIPPWLRRLMEGRDQGCRFPGCHNTRWLHGHHILTWKLDGPTNLDNLVSLCGYHHRLIHRDGWTIEGNPNHELRFYNKWGLKHTPARDRFGPHWVDHLIEGTDANAKRRLHELANPPP